jgi:putative cell wall-binding protein
MTLARRPSIIAALATAAVLVSLAVAPAAARPVDDAAPDLEAAVSGAITGRLLIVPSGGGAPVAANAGYVNLFPDGAWPGAATATASVDGSGNFTFAGQPAGNYDVEFVSTDTRNLPVREWHNDWRFHFDADAITLSDGSAFSFGDVVLEPRQFNSYRVSGANRYATAVEISKLASVDGADRHIIIVNGLTFPDALSAGAFAGREGSPVLMVTSTSIPPETLAELNRLDPFAITIVGGTGVVSAAVQAQLETFLPGPETVERISGSDRYATSRAVVQLMHSQLELSSVFVATGRDYPDALAAVPAAGAYGGAVLLVNGSAASLDTATRNLIDSINKPVTIVGGTGSVSAGIAAEIAGLGVSVDRVQGASRYETATAIADQFFPQREGTYMATGTGFADALAIGWLGSVQQVPLTLSRTTCVPLSVLDNIHDSLIGEYILVGGAGSLSEDLRSSLVPCSS